MWNGSQRIHFISALISRHFPRRSRMVKNCIDKALLPDPMLLTAAAVKCFYARGHASDCYERIQRESSSGKTF